MPREILDHKIRHLLDEILVLASLVEESLFLSVDALKRQDVELARQVRKGDEKINRQRFDLENDCMITIATQQPIMAGDLRMMASILDVVSELERMGDYAKGIAKICIMIGDEPLIKPLIDIPKMAEIASSMLHRAVGAFVHQDAELARQIPADDELVDHLYNEVYRELIAIMFKNPSTIDQANHLMWAAHNLERVADRVSNICERTIYVATGKMQEIDPDEGEA